MNSNDIKEYSYKDFEFWYHVDSFGNFRYGPSSRNSKYDYLYKFTISSIKELQAAVDLLIFI